MDSEMEVGEMIEGIQSEINEDEGDFQSLVMESFEGTSSQGVPPATGDLYNLEVSVAVAEIETEEVNAEFSDALNEIDGKMSFQCDQCDKVCKSKGGLTRHKNSKHCDIEDLDEIRVALCEDTVASFVESIKAKLREENFYGAETNLDLATVSSTVALFNALLPLYKTFCRKKNQDKLLESFYGLIPKSCQLLNCKDYKVANLVMIHLPEHLIGFYNTSRTTGEDSSTPKLAVQLDPAERGPLSYLAGYVVAKLYQLNRRKKGEGNQELHALLQNMKCSESNNYISVRSRGGLVTPCNDLVNILEVAEISFREQVNQGNLALRNIPVEIICNSTLSSPTVKSLWDNIVMSSEQEPSNPTQKLCLENVIKLYLKVRAFSYARDYVTKYRLEKKQLQKKALRKELKKSDTSTA